ncbi:MAG: hypothetical protein HRT70_04675 [Flavobacteriaceae bacterium]|nr:hypothetical protein [Flavobacteriaceae bacterium]
MGTSQSSNGSPSGSPMVPPWTPDIPSSQQPDAGVDGDTPDNAPDTSTTPPADGNESSSGQEGNKDSPIAPPSRFGGARRSMGDYARTGDSSSMKKGLGQYVRKGYGGSATATRRLAGTAITAQSLFSALSTGDNNRYSGEGSALDPAALSGKTAYEVMDIIVEAVAPVDGTQDTEASRESIKDALADLLNAYPNANLNDLSAEQKELAIERFVSGDVFRRIDLDLGKCIREKARNTSSALGRLKEIKDYVRETVYSAFRSLKEIGHVITNNTVVGIVQNSIRETCEVFEGYAE